MLAVLFEVEEEEEGEGILTARKTYPYCIPSAFWLEKEEKSGENTFRSCYIYFGEGGPGE